MSTPTASSASKLNRAALFSSASEEWETPPDLFARLHEEFGFELDVCASEINHKLDAYFTQADDALAQDWGQRVCWMNPPYGRKIVGFMRKAYEASLSGATVVCLVPARTDTRWWHEYAVKGEVRFLRGRLRFVGAKHCAPFPSAVVIFRAPSMNMSSGMLR